ncbi:lectin-like domain-containing protein, partial [Streptococcus halotolerans]
MFHKQKDRFSIRKFKIGVGSVFLGSFLLVAPQVYAEETVNANSEVIAKPDAPLAEQTPIAKESLQLVGENADATKLENEESQPAQELKLTNPEVSQPAEVETPEVSQPAEVKAPEVSAAATPAESKSADSTEKTPENKQHETVEVNEQPTNTNQIGASFRSVGSDRSASDNRESQPFELGNAEYNNKARLEVTKKNMVDYFIVGGNAKGDDVNPTTLTDDVSGQAGSLGLKNKINMNEDFTLIGKLNLGDKYEGYSPNGRKGGDGVSLAFTTANPGVVGLSGASIGLGGIPNSFGFKLDTWHNTSNPDASQKASRDPKINRTEDAAFGAFYSTNGAGVATTDAKDAQKLNNPPMNNEFKDLAVSYNGSTKVMTVTYAGQTFSRNIQNFLDSTRRTTRQKAGEEELAFAIFASTGAGTNLQQFDLTKFEYSTGGNYIKVLYKDDVTGEIIKEKIYSGTTRDTLNLSDKLSLPNYVMKRTNADTAEGYQDENNIAFRSGIQTITYTYAKADKTELKKLVDGDAALKASSDYTTASKETQDAYNAAITEGNKVLADTKAEQPAIDASVKNINDAITALKASAKEAADAAAEKAAALKAAQDAVKAAEDASDAGKAKKADAESDQIVSQQESDDLDVLNQATTDKKATATDLVNALEDGPEKDALKERLTNVVPSEVTVNDKNNNGKDDAQEEAEKAAALKAAQDAVKAAEDASDAGKAKKADAESDQIVSQQES